MAEQQSGVALVLKPHPACKERGEIIDICDAASGLPWASVHVDTFHDMDNPELHNALYRRMETVIVRLVIEVK